MSGSEEAVAVYEAIASAAATTTASSALSYGENAAFGQSGPKLPTLPPQPPPPTPAQSPDSIAAAQAATMRARAAAGFGSTIATSPLGVTSSAPTTGKTLLGS